MKTVERDLPVVLVLARAENGVIGREGGLPWRVRSDMIHFKQLTFGKPIIMGRKTWNSLGKALPDRDNIVVSRDPEFVAEGGYVAADLDAAVVLAEGFAAKSGAAEICIIGGGEIYRAALPIADRIELTEIHMRANGGVSLGPFSKTDWQETGRERHRAAPAETADYSFITLVRRNRPRGP